MTPADLSRRSVAKGAAWSVPAMTIATAAPAMAASPVPSVRGYSYFYDYYQQNLTSPNTMTGEVRSQDPASCSYSVVNGPASVTDLSMTYWLPASNYTFSKVSASPWTTLTRDTSKANRVGTSSGLTFYAYTTTFAGTGSTATTCGPSYSFTAPAVTTSIVNPNAAYYYQFSYTLNGVAKTNPLQAINNP